MTRRNLIRQCTFPYHVTSRSNNKDWFAIPLEEVWKIAMDCFTYAQRLYPIELHAFVLMTNHYHMLLTTPEENLDKFMQVFNKNFSERLKVSSNRINRMFGGPYSWSIINTERYLYNVHRYIYQNPTRANMANQCEEYPFSTLAYKVNNRNFSISLHHVLEYEDHEILDWYNIKLNKHQIDGLRRGLKHAHCKVNPERDSKKLPEYGLPFNKH